MGERPTTVESMLAPTLTGGRRPSRRDLVVFAGYLALAGLVMLPLWRDPAGLVLADSGGDQALAEWRLGYVAHLLTHGGNPFFTTALNPPAGVNLLVGPAGLGLGLLLAPLTLAFGPAWALVTALTAGLAGTASAWYWLLTRRVLPRGDAPPTGHLAAALAGALVGFSPTMVGHAAGAHLPLVAQFLLPFIGWKALTLWRRPVRHGLVLGGLVSAQLLVGPEALLIAALAGGVFLAAHSAQYPGPTWVMVKRHAAGLGVTAGTVLALAGYPLWVMVSGPQSHAGFEGMRAFGAKLPAWVAYSSHSLAGPDQARPHLTLNAAEQNGFLGWSLIVVAVAAAVWLWRLSALSRAVTLTAAVFGVLAAGSDLAWAARGAGVPGPWEWLGRLPLLNSIYPARFAFVVTVCVAVILALALREAAELSFVDPLARRAVAVAVLAALLPLAPTPLPVAERAPAPEFIAAGRWKEFVRPGHTLVVAPRPSAAYTDPMRWQQTAGFGFRLNSGYVVGPNERGDASYYPPERASESIVAAVFRSGRPVLVSAADRAAAWADIRAWRADAVVVDPGLRGSEAARETLTDLLGVADRTVGGLWVWDVRGAFESAPS